MIPSDPQEAIRCLPVKVALQMHSKHRLTWIEMRGLAEYLDVVKANNEQHLIQLAGIASKKLISMRVSAVNSD